MDAHPSNLSTEPLLAHAGWLGALARSLVSEEADAEDLVQETWLAALRRPPTNESALRSWLARTLHNFARMRLRGGAARAAREAEGSREEAVAGPDERARCMETQRIMAELVQGLDEPYRGTLWQRYYEGITPAEIARREGIPASSVRRRLSVALARLRAELDRRHGGDRTIWSRALMPLIGLRAPSTAIAAGTAALIPTSLMVKTLALAAAAAAAVLIAVLALPDESSPADAVLPGPEKEAIGLFEEAPRGSAVQDSRVAVALDPGSDPVDEALGPAGPFRLSARILDERQLPLAGVQARLPVVREAEQTTEADGEVLFEIHPIPFEGRYPLVLQAEGFVEQHVMVEVRAGRTVELGELLLQAGGVVRGSVLDLAGQGVAGAALAAAAYSPGEFDLEDRVTTTDPFGRVRGRADEAGNFRLQGLPPGRYRILARAEGTLVCRSAPFDVLAGSEADAGVITLEPTPAEFVIEGVVRDEDGEPARWAQASLRSAGPGATRLRNATCGQDGGFRFEVSEAGPFDLVVKGPRTNRSASMTGVFPGTAGIELVLGPTPQTQVRVRDHRGAPVEIFNLELWTSFDLATGRRSSAGGPISSAGEPGTRTFPTPLHPFLVGIQAPAHRAVELGPFDPERLEEGIEVTLEELPRLRGRVLAAGEPLEGASVHVRGVVDPLQLQERNGFPVERGEALPGGCSTDEHGRFELPIRGIDGARGNHAAKSFVVQVRAEGFATSESVPFGHAGPPGELEFELTRGGSIEGRVIGAEAVEHVAASCGNGRIEVVEIDEERRYRFENLRPGSWRVRPYPRKFLFNSLGGSFHGEEHPWDCFVSEGRTTVLDLDPGADEHVLRGRLDTTAGAYWTASFRVPGRSDSLTRENYHSAEVSPEGDFELTAPQPGRHILELRCSVDDGEDIRVYDAVEVSSGEPWSFGWDVAPLEGRLENVELLGDETLWHAWNPAPERWVLTRVRVDREGHFEARVPAGEGALVRIAEHRPPRPEAGQELAALRMPRDGMSNLRVPLRARVAPRSDSSRGNEGER